MTSRLGTEKSLTFFTVYVQESGMSIEQGRDPPYLLLILLFHARPSCRRIVSDLADLAVLRDQVIFVVVS